LDKRYYLPAIVTFILAVALSASAASPLVLNDRADVVTMGRYLDYLPDPGGKLTIADVTATAMAKRFVPADRDIPNFGVSSTAYWFRFTVEEQTSGRRHWLIELDQPLMDYADLYVLNPDGTFQAQYSGDMRPMSRRTIRTRSILFSLPPGPGRVTCYLRGQINGRSQFPLVLYSEDRFQELEVVRGYAFGGFIGFVLTIAVICLSLYVFIRERSFIYYVFYILAVAVYHLTIAGYLFSLVLPEHPVIHDYCVPLVCLLSLLGTTLFVREFLITRRHAPIMDKPLRIWIWANLVLMPLNFVIPMVYFKTVVILDALILALLLIAVSVEAVRRGYRPARYVLAAKVLQQIAVIVFVLLSLDLISYSPYYTIAMTITPLLDGILIAFAQGERFNLLNRKVRGLVSDLQQQIDQRTAANKALQEEISERIRLEHEVAQISDNERLRLGHDLHDGLCQQLGAALLRCNLIEEDLAGSPNDVDNVRALGTILEDAIRDAYGIAKGLCPLDLDPESLVPALRRLVSYIELSTDLECDFHHDETILMVDRERALHVYRIAQEAVANAVRHAGASRIVMELRCLDGKLRLWVSDNGRGMGERESSSLGGMGLRIMAYRARMIGGDLTIEKSPGGGTRVACVASLA
jgi:signal transduction histidine kinase